MMSPDTAVVVELHTARVVFFFNHRDDIFAVHREMPGDDLPDVAAPEDHDVTAGIAVVDIDHFLHLAGCVNAVRTGTADAE